MISDSDFGVVVKKLILIVIGINLVTIFSFLPKIAFAENKTEIVESEDWGYGTLHLGDKWDCCFKDPLDGAITINLIAHNPNGGFEIYLEYGIQNKVSGERTGKGFKHQMECYDNKKEQIKFDFSKYNRDLWIVVDGRLTTGYGYVFINIVRDFVKAKGSGGDIYLEYSWSQK